MDNPFSQVPSEASKLVKTVVVDTAKGLGNVAKDTVSGSVETVLMSPNNPFVQAASNSEAGKPDKEIQQKKLAERQAALRAIRRVREDLERVQKQTNQRKTQEAQMEARQNEQKKSLEEQRKASWKDILLRQASQKGGTGETKNVGV